MMPEAAAVIREAERNLYDLFGRWDEVAYENQVKVLQAFQQKKVRDYHFSPTSGYGYGDQGREILEDIYALVFQGEDALVRPQLVSGTHAISACLFSLLGPGQELLSVLGTPYDTLRNLIGPGPAPGNTLVEKGVRYREIPLGEGGLMDLEAIRSGISHQTRVVFIQRSRGYSLRPALTTDQMEQLIRLVKSRNRDCVVMVDNCYGEFTAVTEPGAAGADLTVGSLIKNPGGGLAPAGGYITGRQTLVRQIAEHITAPGLGKNLGASLSGKRLFYQGLFLAPHVVLQALKGAALLAYVFEQMGYATSPRWFEERGDIVQAVLLHDFAQVERFAQIVQNASPVDSDLTLEFAPLDGYEQRVIMAAGTFVQGSSLEMSCDAPRREPFAVFYQGGLTYEHCRYLAGRLYEAFKNGMKAGDR